MLADCTSEVIPLSQMVRWSLKVSYNSIVIKKTHHWLSGDPAHGTYPKKWKLSWTREETVGHLVVAVGHLFTCSTMVYRKQRRLPGVPKKADPLVYFDDNFGKYGPILTIFSLLQQEIHDTQQLSHFSHLTFIMLPLYIVKQILILVSVFYMFVLMKLMVHISQT